MADSETPGRGSDESPEVCDGCTEHPATSCDDARAQSRSYVPRMAASGARDTVTASRQNDGSITTTPRR